ncbi:hypothetical protein AB0O87_02815 [Microbacterium sp. NPDC076768]|uniref:hypothetical protein n=1 Tax=Microbacterium sp. NPDC076768 TaxID=3154858 RepID=UPI00341E4F12
MSGFHHVELWVADSASTVDEIIEDAPAHGWRPLYQERYPHAGGEDHYAGWIENSAGFKAEVIAPTSRA